MGWIMGCLDHLCYCIMINGTSKGVFKSSQGLRQGDPLSLFLFSLVADVFSVLMLKVEEVGIIKGFHASKEGLFISHLQFADDTICFVNASVEQVHDLNLILRTSKCIFGVKVIIFKSSLVGIGMGDEEVTSCVEIIGCRKESWSLKYLDMPLGGNPRSLAFWDLVVERINKKLVVWKKSYFIGVQITLIKVAMVNMSVYYISLFKMPRKVDKMLEKGQHD